MDGYKYFRGVEDMFYSAVRKNVGMIKGGKITDEMFWYIDGELRKALGDVKSKWASSSVDGSDVECSDVWLTTHEERVRLAARNVIENFSEGKPEEYYKDGLGWFEIKETGRKIGYKTDSYEILNGKQN